MRLFLLFLFFLRSAGGILDKFSWIVGPYPLQVGSFYEATPHFIFSKESRFSNFFVSGCVLPSGKILDFSEGSLFKNEDLQKVRRLWRDLESTSIYDLNIFLDPFSLDAEVLEKDFANSHIVSQLFELIFEVCNLENKNKKLDSKNEVEKVCKEHFMMNSKKDVAAKSAQQILAVILEFLDLSISHKISDFLGTDDEKIANSLWFPGKKLVFKGEDFSLLFSGLAGVDRFEWSEEEGEGFAFWDVQKVVEEAGGDVELFQKPIKIENPTQQNIEKSLNSFLPVLDLYERIYLQCEKVFERNQENSRKITSSTPPFLFLEDLCSNEHTQSLSPIYYISQFFKAHSVYPKETENFLGNPGVLETRVEDRWQERGGWGGRGKRVEVYSLSLTSLRTNKIILESERVDTGPSLRGAENKVWSPLYFSRIYCAGANFDLTPSSRDHQVLQKIDQFFDIPWGDAVTLPHLFSEELGLEWLVKRRGIADFYDNLIEDPLALPPAAFHKNSEKVFPHPEGGVMFMRSKGGRWGVGGILPRREGMERDLWEKSGFPRFSWEFWEPFQVAMEGVLPPQLFKSFLLKSDKNKLKFSEGMQMLNELPVIKVVGKQIKGAEFPKSEILRSLSWNQKMSNAQRVINLFRLAGEVISKGGGGRREFLELKKDLSPLSSSISRDLHLSTLGVYFAGEGGMGGGKVDMERVAVHAYVDSVCYTVHNAREKMVEILSEKDEKKKERSIIPLPSLGERGGGQGRDFSTRGRQSI